MYYAKRKPQRAAAQRTGTEEKTCRGNAASFGYRWAHLEKGGTTLRAWRDRHTPRNKQGCPHCGVGQVDRHVGETCGCCGAVVVRVEAVVQ